MNFREYPITTLLTDVVVELIAHLPLASHPNPKKVLIMGGGDGSIVGEVLKHDTVEQVVLCDVDEVRSELPLLSYFQVPCEGKVCYDIIISDSFDAVGPAKTNSTKFYLQLLYDTVTPGGQVSIRGGCP
jgi:spermidine synthase